MRQASATCPPCFDQLDERIFYYCKTDNPVTRRSHTRDQDLKLFKEKQLVGINLRGAHPKVLSPICQAALTPYINICILPPCPKNPSSGSHRRSMMSDRFRKMPDALQDTSCISSSRGWNRRIGNRWHALAKEFMKSESTRALNIVSCTSRSSAKGSTCFTPFRRNHEQRRQVTSIWQRGD